MDSIVIMHFEKVMKREYESNENSFKQLIFKIVSLLNTEVSKDLYNFIFI